MSEPLDLAGIGIGPFNLSLAALLEPVTGLRARFFESKSAFSWHEGQLLPATRLQTSFLKDLVTPVDPTNRHSFLAYLVEKGRFYAFVHADHAAVSRAEFADYLDWVAGRLASLRFAASVDAVDIEDGIFCLRGRFGEARARNLALATGREPALPAWAEALVGPRFFHVSRLLHERPDVAGLRVAIVGGGQSGAEAFLTLARDVFGRARSLTWISRRMGFAPLDETHLTNEWFTPGYVHAFHALAPERRLRHLQDQRLASDGISPSTLAEIYQLLYERRHLALDGARFRLLPGREAQAADLDRRQCTLALANRFDGGRESVDADLVVMATGFAWRLPDCLAPLADRIAADGTGAITLDQHFRLAWEGPRGARIYVLNGGLHSHGIAEPQLSLMAWRSAVIANDLAGRACYRLPNPPPLVEWSTAPAVPAATAAPDMMLG
jgi:lysine N6-hydroxylase